MVEALLCVCCCCTMILDNDIGTEGAKALAPALGRFTQSKELDLSGESCGACECVHACV